MPWRIIAAVRGVFNHTFTLANKWKQSRRFWAPAWLLLVRQAGQRLQPFAVRHCSWP